MPMTEDDLRQAFQERAARWEQELERTVHRRGEFRVPADAPLELRVRRRRGYRPVVIGVAVAATVAAVTATGALVGRSAVSDAPAAWRSSSVAATSTATMLSTRAKPIASAPAASVLPHEAPPRPTGSTAATKHAPRAPVSPGHAATGSLTNLITVGGTHALAWDMREDIELVTVELGGTGHASIAVYPSSAGFAPSRVAGSEPVTVDGRPGLYGEVSDWPANGHPDPVSGKQDGPQVSVAWQLSDGTWTVVSADTNPNRQQLVDLANSLHIRPGPVTLPVPLTVGWLPHDYRVSWVSRLEPRTSTQFKADFSVILIPTSSRPAASDTPPSDAVTIGLAPVDPPGTPSYALPPLPSGSLSIKRGGYEVTVTGATLTVGQRAAISDSIKVVADPGRPGPSWPLLAAALP